MPKDSELFRKEVFQSEKYEHGDVVLVYPISNYMMMVGAFILLLAIVAFISVGEYTRHVSISGVLEPAVGVVKLQANQNGVLKRLRVREGQVVHKGDILLDFELEHVDANGHVAEADIDRTLVKQLEALHRERNGTAQLNEIDIAKSRLNLTALEDGIRSLQAEFKTQEQRVHSEETALARYQQLHTAGFMSQIQVQQKQNEVLDQRLRLQSMQTNIANTSADIDRLRIELSSGPLKGQVARDQIDRAISNVEADLTKQQINRVWSVVAPCDGVVTALAISLDQHATSGNPLISIVPSDSKLQATLYAPSRSIGFLQYGQAVEIRLDAFPYQKFGAVAGRVLAIAETPLTAQERQAGTRLATSINANEPVYTVQVELGQQWIFAYGEQQKLRPGFQLEADIQLDTRRIFEWILEPLYSLRRA
ncbi:HlyD family secretion protein [Duganella sp. P38]|uniref:HlyD family secretion protein n=1 Tax=Duganella sp. P38 TaxID=3423949 RepID=UPI003D78EB9F